MSNQTKMLVVGSRGNVAGTLLPKLREHKPGIIVVSLAELSTGSHTERIRFWKEVIAGDDKIELVWISACTSNDVPGSELLKLNYELPVEAISTIAGTNKLAKVTTFGTALEGRGLENNNYVKSKERLSEWLAQCVDESERRHIRTHTLISNFLPKSHMFLGQLLSSIRRRETLYLRTNGRQVREYLDLETFVSFIANAILTNNDTVGSQETIGGGNLLSLKEVVGLVRKHHFADLQVEFATETDSEGEVYRENPIYNSINLPFIDSRSLLIRRFGEWLVES